MSNRCGGMGRPAVLRLALLGLAAAAAFARGEGILRGDLRPLVPCIRPGAPIPVEVTLDWSGAGILEGHLDIALGGGGEPRSRHESGDIALTSGRQTFRLLLPPLDTPDVGRNELATAQVRFVTPSRAFPILKGQIPVRTGGLGASTVIAICRERAAGDDGPDIERSLRAELDDGELDPYSGQQTRTYAARWSAEDAPANALAYCAFDLLYLAPESLPLLKTRQVEAIARWVAAGGSVCLGEDAAAPAAPRAFLDGLAACAGPPAPAGGSAVDGGRPCHLVFGLGRCAIVAGGAAVPAETRRHLWNVTPGARAGRAAQAQHWRRGAYRRQQFDSECASALISALLPGDVHPVPLGALSLVLLGLLIAVGPLDYWLLGRLRLRRLTWVLFPALVALTTVGVVQLANASLGRHHRSREMTVVDVGADGRPLRSNTFAVVFAGRSGQVDLACREALWAQGGLSANPYYARYRYRRYRTSPSDSPAATPVTRGAFPLRYDASLPVAQWQPVWHHTFRYGGDAPVPPVAWNAVDAAYLKTGPAMEAIRKRILSAGARPDAQLALCRGQTWTQERVDPTLLQALQRLTGGSDDIPAGTPCPTAPGVGIDLARLSLRHSAGDSAPVLVLIVPRGKNYEVYRRRYDER